MRKVLISIAAAGAALAVASPAAAQYYQQPQSYGYTNGGYNNGAYGQQYGHNGYGQNNYGQNNYGQLRSLQARIDAVQYRINQMSRYTGGRGTKRLREESRNVEHQLRQAARNGLNPYEATQIQYRIAQLEQRVQYGAGNRYGGYGNNHEGYGSGYGYNNNGDRDDDRRGYGDRDDDHGDD